MARSDGNSILPHLRWLLSAEQYAADSDSQLLDRFVQSGDEMAFAGLMRRHGKLVLGVCKRVLHHQQDAEDVFQATFLILARKANSIRRHQTIGSWLYRTAWRLAQKSRQRSQQQRIAETKKVAATQADPLADVSLRELRVILDEELARLPDKYRAPLLLCYFEGRTQDEAANQLGWHLCTLKARMARGRDLLRGQLVRRGLPLGVALMGTLLSSDYALCHVPAQVAQATCEAAALNAAGMPMAQLVSKTALTLVEGAIREMAAIKVLKIAFALALFLGLVGTSMGLVLGPAAPSADVPDRKPMAAAPAEQKVDGLPLVDALGDPLPAGALMRLGTQRWRHGQAIVSVAWSPDGNWIASAGGGNDNFVRLWDIKNGKEISQFLGHSNGSRTVAIAADGRLAASHDIQGTLFVWETTSGKALNKRRMAATPGISCLLAFVGDGKRLVALDEQGKVCLVETATLKTVKSFSTAGAPPVVCLAVSNDGKLLATADTFFKIRLYDVESSKLLHTIENPSQVECLALAPNGKMLASGAKDKTIILWDTISGKKVRVLEGHEAPVRSIAFMPNGKQLLSGGEDGIARLWDVSKGAQVRQYPENRYGLCSVAVSPDGKCVAAAGGGHKVRLWETDSGKELFPEDGHVNYITALVVLGDGKTVLTAAADDYIRLWDRFSGESVGRIFAPHAFRIQEPRSFPKGIAISSDRKLIATGAQDGTIRLFGLPGGKQLATFKKENDQVHVLAFSPDGKWLVCHTNNDKTWLWNVATQEAIRALHHSPEAMDSLAFAPDSTSLWMGSLTGKLYLWDTAADRELGRLPAHKNSVQDIVISSDGKLMASLSKDQTIRVFDSATVTEIRRFSALVGFNGPLAFSPDGRVLATGERQGPIRLLEIASGQPRATFLGHRGAVSALAFFPDSQALVSGGADGTALVWDLTGSRRDKQKSPIALTAEDLEAEWKNLHGQNAARAYQAMLKLAANREQVLAKLQKELLPIQPVDAKAIAQWIADLEDKDFKVRERASDGLKNASDLAWPALKAVVDNPPSLEAQARARQLLGNQIDPIVPNEARLRLIRSLELLERLDLPGARALTQKLADGAPEAWLTKEAKAMLKRN